MFATSEVIPSLYVVNIQYSTILLISIFIIILLILSAINSGLEMALASVNRIRIKTKAENGEKKSKKVLKLIENYDNTTTTIIVFNNIVNILLATVSSAFFISLYPKYGVIISTIVMTLLILIFGEIIPKIYGKQNSEKMLNIFIGFLNLSIKILKPVVYLFLLFNNSVQKKLKNDVDENDEQNEVEDEILTIIQESEDEGKMDEDYSELIRNAVEFNEIRVEEILTARDKMVLIDIETSNEEILKILKEGRFSRVPIYEDISDNIIGVLYVRDFYHYYTENKDIEIRQILRQASFVPDSLKISKLLVQLQQNHNHMSLVVDERGTVQGLVTIEDIIEELVGEIWDEHDDIELDIIKLADNKFEILSNCSINDFNEYFSVKDIEAETDEMTISGYLLEMAERIPNKGDLFEDDHFKYTIVEVSGKKIEKIIVQLKN